MLLLQLPTGNNNASYSLRQIYQKYLLPYEEYEHEKLRREMDEAASNASGEQEEPARVETAAGEKRARSPDAEDPPSKKPKNSKVRPCAWVWAW